MPTTVYRGTQADISSGPTTVNIHHWTAWAEEPQFPATAASETAQVFVAGDPIGRLVIVGSPLGNTIPAPGDTLSNCTLKTNSGGTSYTNNYRCVNVRWDIERRGGGPPQDIITEWITTDTTPRGILGT